MVMMPELNDPCWRRVLTTSTDMAAASLATRIMIARMRREVAEKPACLFEQIQHLHAFYAKNSFARADIARF